MDWLGGLQALGGLAQMIAANQAGGIDYQDVPVTAGERQSRKLLGNLINSSLANYTGAPLNVVPDWKKVQSQYGEIMAQFPTATKYSGQSAYATPQTGALGRQQDIRSAILNTQLANAGRRLAMGAKFAKRQAVDRDTAEALQRYLNKMGANTQMDALKQQLFLQGLGQMGSGLTQAFYKPPIPVSETSANIPENWIESIPTPRAEYPIGLTPEPVSSTPSSNTYTDWLWNYFKYGG